MPELQQTFARGLMNPALISAISDVLWPLAFFGVAMVFRGEIKALVSRLTHAKILGHELDFSAGELRESVSETVRVSESNWAGRRLTEPLMQSVFSEENAPGQRHASVSKGVHGLLDRPIGSADLAVLQIRLVREPASTVLIISAELERSLMNLLINDGKLPADMGTIEGRPYRKPILAMARSVEKEYSLPASFSFDVKRFLTVRNHLAHGNSEGPEADLIEVGCAALELIKLVQRIPRRILYVERSDIPVYLNEKLTDRLQGYEALYLLEAAQPGQTGAVFAALTDKLNYYVPGRRVSSKWEPRKGLPDVFVKHPDAESAVRISCSEEIFCGEDIERIP